MIHRLDNLYYKLTRKVIESILLGRNKNAKHYSQVIGYSRIILLTDHAKNLRDGRIKEAL